MTFLKVDTYYRPLNMLSSNSRLWRNWQTRKIQVLVSKDVEVQLLSAALFKMVSGGGVIQLFPVARDIA